MYDFQTEANHKEATLKLNMVKKSSVQKDVMSSLNDQANPNSGEILSGGSRLIDVT